MREKSREKSDFNPKVLVEGVVKIYLLVKSLHNVPIVYRFTFHTFPEKDMRLVYQALSCSKILADKKKAFYIERFSWK